VKRATRLGALLLACAGCAHAPVPLPDPASTSDSFDYSVPASPPSPNPAPGAPAPSSGAAAGPTATSAENAARLASVRAAVDQSLTAQAKLLWETWLRGAPPDLEAKLARRDPLFSPSTLVFVKDARERAAGKDRRTLSLLHAYLVGEHLSREAAAGSDAPQPALTWDGRPVPISRVPSLLASEPDPARRTALEHAWVEARRRQGAADDARWRGIAVAGGRVGYGSLLALAADLRGEPIEALAALAQGALAATDATYRTLFQALARLEMGQDLSSLRGRDVPRLLRAGEDVRAFPAGRATVDVGETLAALGLQLANRPGAVLDLEARPGKDPRPLALPVEVPGSVRVSFAPQGGAAELRALLHEMGAATFYAHVTSPVLEFRRLGTVTAEAWAFLFEDLAGDPAWLAERTGLAESHVAPLVRAAAARRLLGARTLAARILVEIAREREPGRARDVARAVLESAFARPVEADELELFLQERDPLLESADALRALLLAAQAEAFLTGRAGSSWWRSKESGAWLATAFAEGSRLAPAELARAFGAANVDASALESSSRARAAAAGIRLAQAGPR
jgi:hypothetical protein